MVVGVRLYPPSISPLCFFSQICWYLAAVVQVQLCKYFIEIGDVSRETTIWGEINVLRYASILPRKILLPALWAKPTPTPASSSFGLNVPIHPNRSAMMAYGERSPIGSEPSVPHLRFAVILKLYPARQEKLLQGLMSEIVRLTSQMQPLDVGVPLYPFSRETAFDKPSPTSAPLPSGSPFEDESDSPNLRSISRAETVNSHSGINVSGTNGHLWSTSPGDMSPFAVELHKTSYP